MLFRSRRLTPQFSKPATPAQENLIPKNTYQHNANREATQIDSCGATACYSLGRESQENATSAPRVVNPHSQSCEATRVDSRGATACNSLGRESQEKAIHPCPKRSSGLNEGSFLVFFDAFFYAAQCQDVLGQHGESIFDFCVR